MEPLPDDPSVTEALEKLQERIGRPVLCPCCGESNWRHARDLISSVGVLVHADDDPDALREDPARGWANITALVLVCEKCAFIRRHFVNLPPDPETT